MKFEWDPAKNSANKIKHGVGLDVFEGWDGEPFVVRDERVEYREERFVALGRIGGLPHALVYTLRGSTVRLISLRRAHEKEMRGRE